MGVPQSGVLNVLHRVVCLVMVIEGLTDYLVCLKLELVTQAAAMVLCQTHMTDLSSLMTSNNQSAGVSERA